MSETAGWIERGVHRITVRVYYEDTDMSGAVYHANYLRFCERGRSDCLRLLGIKLHEPSGPGGFVVRRMVCDFRKPAAIDDLLTVETRFREMAGARMELQQTVLRDGDSLFLADVTAALLDRQGRPRRLPAELHAAVKSLLESKP
ncbi:MAG: tol-pal system-associated acyl-CoA thioesterase [Aestuariivirga sp.]